MTGANHKLPKVQFLLNKGSILRVEETRLN